MRSSSPSSLNGRDEPRVNDERPSQSRDEHQQYANPPKPAAMDSPSGISRLFVLPLGSLSFGTLLTMMLMALFLAIHWALLSDDVQRHLSCLQFVCQSGSVTSAGRSTRIRLAVWLLNGQLERRVTAR